MPENEWHIAEYVISYYPFGQPLSTPADRRRLSEAHALLRLDDWVRFQEQALLDMYWKMGDRLGFGIVPIRSPPKSFDQIRERLAEAIGHGELVVYARELPTIRRSAPPVPLPVLAPVAPTPSKVQEWRIECAHHAEEGKRAVIHRGTHIQVVPSKWKYEDLIKIHVRDDENGMPQSLNTGTVNVPMVGMSASNYAVYQLKAAYEGGLGSHCFPLPAYWEALSKVTTYRVTGAPSTIQVDVYNPRQHKIELKLPPFRKYTNGSKLSNVDRDLESKEKEKVVPVEKPVRWNIKEHSGWSPSKLQLNKTTTATRAGEHEPTAQSEKSENKSFHDAIAFWQDGVQVKVNALDVLKRILEIHDEITSVIETIQKGAPNVGWYFESSIQLLQGAFAAEWYWKEHTDHRVFRYLDVNAALELVGIELELGVGLKGLGFRAQAYLKLSGALSLTADARRDDPDATGFTITSDSSITGAIGVRFTVGKLLDFEGRGESGFKIAGTLGLHCRPDEVWSFDLDIEWTGFKIVVEVQHTDEDWNGIATAPPWEYELAAPKELGKRRWPAAPEASSPSWVSRDRIKQIVLDVITEGFDLEVVRQLPPAPAMGVMVKQEVTLDSKQVAKELAREIDKHATFDRSEKGIEGLAHAIRQDLERMGYRGLVHPCVEESKYQGYLKRGLKDRMDAMVRAAKAAAKANVP